MNSFDTLLITHAYPDHYIWTLNGHKIVKTQAYLTDEILDSSRTKSANTKVIGPGKSFDIKILHMAAYRVMPCNGLNHYWLVQENANPQIDSSPLQQADNCNGTKMNYARNQWAILPGE